jgi:hypothetical protein
MLARTFDSTLVNRIVNSPECVNGVFCGYGPFDISHLVADPKNHFLFDDQGGFSFMQEAPSEYEIHAQFLKAGRGPRVLEETKAALAYIFQRGAKRVTSWIPDKNKYATVLANKLNFRLIGPLDVARVPGMVYELTKDMWNKQCQS